MTTMTNPSFTQATFRGYEDGTQTGSTAIAAQDTNFSRGGGSLFHLRFRVQQTDAGANQNLSVAFKLKYSKNSAAYADVGAQASSTAARMVDSSSITDAENITTGNFRLGTGSGTAIAGECEENNSSDTITFSSGAQSYTELLFVIELHPSLNAENDTFDFRVYTTGDVALNAYTVTPRVTIPRTLSAESGTYTETGTAANLEYGRLFSTAGGSYAWSGTAANLEYGRRFSLESGTYTWAGTAANLEKGYEVAAASGSYIWTGSDATLTYNTGEIILSAESGSYTWTGTATSLEKGYEVAANSGSYILTGTASNLEYGRRFSLEAGIYTKTGTAASLEKGYEIVIGSGSYVWTGTDVTLTHGTDVVLNAESGSYIWTGTAINLEKGYEIAAATTAFIWTGTTAGLNRVRSISLVNGSYTWNGSNLAFSRDYVLIAITNAFTYTGKQVSFRKSMFGTTSGTSPGSLYDTSSVGGTLFETTSGTNPEGPYED